MEYINSSGNVDSWLRYDLSTKGESLEIHMENSLYPNSFLSDNDHFYGKLKEGVLEAEKYGFKKFWTVSWLNDLPIWKKKMPDQWNKSISNRNWDIEWHLGFWGQFLTANMCFNFGTAKYLREKGKLMFPMSRAEATLDSFKKHIGV